MRSALNAGVAMVLASATAAPAWAAIGNPTTHVVPIACDRECMVGLLTGVLSAMASHDVGTLPLSHTLKATENGVTMPLYDGLWQTASATGRYRLDVVDTESGQAATIATIKENGTPILLALRIRVREQKIDEIETIVSRGAFMGGSPGDRMEQAGTPRRQFFRTVPARERMSREALTQVANSYFANLQGSTGKSAAPFAKTCNRIENGAQTTNVTANRPDRKGFDVLKLGCEAQQRSGFYPFVTSIRDRRFPIVDRERGLVFAFGYFDHNGTVSEIRLSDGATVPSPLRTPTTLQIAELFQMDQGKIDQVEAVMNGVPYRFRSPTWDGPE